jgi:hypothetical protein
MTPYRPLLKLFIVWHPSADEVCRPLAMALYQSFNRDPDRPMARGIGIPTYFRCVNQPEKDTPLDIALDAAEHTVILVLVEAHLVIAKSWGNTLAADCQACQLSGGRHLFLPVALSQSAFNLHPEIADSNFIRLYDKPAEDVRSQLLHFATHALARLLENSQNSMAQSKVLSPLPIKLFISHTKREADALVLAKAIKAALENTQLARFFDSVDIASGADFAKVIEANIEDAGLLVIHSDRYSESPWCRKEVLLAKRMDRPIIVVDVLKDREDRSFPYLTNVPVIRFDSTLDAPVAAGKLQAIIDFALREVLRFIYQQRHLKHLQTQNHLPPEAVLLSRPPEQRDLKQHGGQSLIVYPDPPLGYEEVSELEGYGIALRTPATLQDRPWQGLAIGISISDADPGELRALGLSDLHLQDAMLEIARYCLAQGATLVYGGDLRPGGFTENLLELVRYHNDALQKQFTPVANYLAWPLTINLDAEWQAQNADALQIEPIDAPDDLKQSGLLPDLHPGDDISTLPGYVWARCLTAMREVQVQHIQARIMLGGRTLGYKGKYPGLVEEALITLQARKPLFLLGGFGGAARVIIQALQGENPNALTEAYQSQNPGYSSLIAEFNQHGQTQTPPIQPIDYAAVCKTFAEIGINGLNNGLSVEDNQRLFETQNQEEAISLILAGLTRIRNQEK